MCAERAEIAGAGAGRQGTALVVSLALVALVAVFGRQFEPGPWYAELRKPGWTPPSWVFGPVWTLLYLLMAVAAWLVWRTRRPLAGARRAQATAALIAHGIQLGLNAAWSWLFFGERLIGLAAVELGLLWLAVLATTVLFWRTRPVAGALLVPYLLWTSYAGALNLQIWRLNA